MPIHKKNSLSKYRWATRLFKNITWVTVILFPFTAFAQIQTQSFEQIDKLQQTQQKPMVVFVHTDWCRYCQTMKNTTFQNEEVVQLLNENFWFADLYAEEKNDIYFKGHTFSFKPTGRNTGIHELAIQLGSQNGKINFPALCILNEDYEIIFLYDGFLSSKEMIKILNQVLKSA